MTSENIKADPDIPDLMELIDREFKGMREDLDRLTTRFASVSGLVTAGFQILDARLNSVEISVTDIRNEDAAPVV